MPLTFNQKATACIPASTTNLGPGFDVLGLALQLYSKGHVGSHRNRHPSRC